MAVFPALGITTDEQTIIDSLQQPKPCPHQETPLREMRASVLRRLILQQPLLPTLEKTGTQTQEELAIVPIPLDGLKLRRLRILNEVEQASKRCLLLEDGSHLLQNVLDLEDACLPANKSLPPLELEECIFELPLYMSRARFRGVSLQGSQLTHLKAEGLIVDGSVLLSYVSSSENNDGKTGATTYPGRDGFIIQRLRPNEPPPANEPMDPKHDAFRQWFEDNPGQTNARCWIDLRDARIGIDLIASGATFCCPPQRTHFINSPHAHYALDLRGSHVEGRVVLCPDESSRAPAHFTAFGGVSIVRAHIGGSICASGACLLAVEGDAFSAQRAHIRGHVFMDFSWEARTDWQTFTARGFIDFTHAHIGSSLYMNGAQLLRDCWTRAGFYGAGLTVGDGCHFRGVLRKAKGTTTTDLHPYVPFLSQGGVNLSRSTLGGALHFNGAHLEKGSFENALYAHGITVHGRATLTASKLHAGLEAKAFIAEGTVVLTAGVFRKSLDLSGAKINEQENVEKSKRRFDAPAIEAAQIMVAGSLLLRPAVREENSDKKNSTRREIFLPTRLYGSVILSNASIGMDADFSGTHMEASHDEQGNYLLPALDLTCTKIQSDLRMGVALPREYVALPAPDNSPERRKWFKQTGKRKGTELLLAHDRFIALGSVIVRGTEVGKDFILTGASLTSLENTPALDARDLHVTAQVDLSCLYFQKRGNEPQNEKLRLSFSAKGSLDFCHANLPGGLRMTGSILEPPKEQRKENEILLLADSARIQELILDDSEIRGPVHLRQLGAEIGVSADRLVITNGILDLWEAALGYLYLKGIGCSGEIPLKERHADKEGNIEILHLGRVKVHGKLSITMNRGYVMQKAFPNRICINLHELEVGTLDDNNGEGWNPDFPLLLEGFTCKRAPFRKASVKMMSLYKGEHGPRILPPVCHRRITQRLILLLSKGYDLDAYMKERTLHPTPNPADSEGEEYSGQANGTVADETNKKNGRNMKAVSWWRKPDLEMAKNLFRTYHGADAHVRWLELQYGDNQDPNLREFSSSAYDKLAELLREDGHENDSNRILSAKFRVKRTVDVHSRVAQGFWRAYGFFFDYGLSSVNALLTFAFLISCGSLFFYVADQGAHPHADWAIVKKYPSLAKYGWDPVMEIAPGPATLVAMPKSPNNPSYASDAQKDKPTFGTLYASATEGGKEPPPWLPSGSTATPQQLQAVDEIPCGNRIDIIPYAFETFVPAFELTQTKLCEISTKPEHWGWRWTRLIYILLGWIVTSITLLTVPGILRARAEE